MSGRTVSVARRPQEGRVFVRCRPGGHAGSVVTAEIPMSEVEAVHVAVELLALTLGARVPEHRDDLVRSVLGNLALAAAAYDPIDRSVAHRFYVRPDAEREGARLCSACGGEQRHTPSGWVCAAGHGGAPSVAAEHDL